MATRQDWDLSVQAHAKINLGLYVLKKRTDGYHDILTIFQELEFHDTLHFLKTSGALEISTTHPNLSTGADNLVYQAIRLICRHTSCPDSVKIHLDKRIPLGAGLGGGSSNAAAALFGMNQLFQLGLNHTELAALGAELGSDVPFFFYGGTAFATGRGETIQSISDFQEGWIALVNPGIHVSSGWAYKNLNLKLTKFPDMINVLSRMRNGNIVLTGAQYAKLHNMLEIPVIEKYPIIRSIKTHLLSHGAKWTLMSGSGSTVFGIFDNRTLGENALQQLAQPEWLKVVTRTKQRRTLFRV